MQSDYMHCIAIIIYFLGGGGGVNDNAMIEEIIIELETAWTV